MPCSIPIDEYNPQWPEYYRREEVQIRQALGDRALQIEHAGSTAVPGLPAKPVIDIVLAVADSADEGSFVKPLELAGYWLCIREPHWHEHRMFRKTTDPAVNLHVFSEGCVEMKRMLRFRDWLRTNAGDRDLYLHTKRDLAGRQWDSVDQYAEAKGPVVREIMRRAATEP
jgi:GrpB-like predicted nucleotidyltransferase (UPF0157 family)